jgi:hypothetical protein
MLHASSIATPPVMFVNGGAQHHASAGCLLLSALCWRQLSSVGASHAAACRAVLVAAARGTRCRSRLSSARITAAPLSRAARASAPRASVAVTPCATLGARGVLTTSGGTREEGLHTGARCCGSGYVLRPLARAWLRAVRTETLARRLTKARAVAPRTQRRWKLQAAPSTPRRSARR